MSSAGLKHQMTASEFLAFERASEVKHQLYNGEVFAMAGASRVHNLIAVNITRVLGNQLANRQCEAYVADMRVAVEKTGLYTYPDVVVACDEPRFQDDKLDTLTNPTVLVEVLSPSTERFDRGRKFQHYQQIESLRDYVLISQDRMLVEHYTRQGNNWLLTVLSGPDDVLRLPSVDCVLTLYEIYTKVRFEEAERTPDPSERTR